MLELSWRSTKVTYCTEYKKLFDSLSGCGDLRSPVIYLSSHAVISATNVQLNKAFSRVSAAD
jgi:hypothetical protein